MATLGHRPGTAERSDTCGSFPHRTLPFRCVFDTLGPVGEDILPIMWWGFFTRAFIVELHISESAEGGILESWGRGLGGGFRASCTLGFGLLEPVFVGH